MRLDEKRSLGTLLLENLKYLFRPVVASKRTSVWSVIECQHNPD
jgi:hypothetical protein